MLIVCLTQIIIISFLLGNAQFSNCFHILIFPILIACTVIITIGGYLINDFFDYEIDKINKPSKLSLPKNALLKLYIYHSVLGFILAIYIAFEVGSLYYVSIYLLAILILFLYAAKLKSIGLMGNLVVSIFSSLVVAIIWFVFDLICESAPYENTKIILILFMCFIFLSSMAREIIKDCQDVVGDKQFGLKTLPIRIGTDKAIIFVLFFLASLIAICCTWIYYSMSNYPIYKSVILFVTILILVYAMIKTNKAKSSLDFKSISKILKISMGFGILYLFTLSLPS